jgi:hypothetical protein
MENKTNERVPMAILSCFLIAFILQGILKISGVFVFEKALTWEIFNIIDNNMWLQIIYYSLIVLITTYCLSFALTIKPYSKKWYHYVILICASVTITTIRLYVKISYELNIILDILIYVCIPLLINLTTCLKDRLFNNSVSHIILTITIQISLYFCYLGLGYWSTLLTSILPLNTMWLTASQMFLTQIEMYIGIITFMLSMNFLIKYIKENIIMRMPVDIASDEAKKKELEDKKTKNKSKKNGK